jgi:cytosine/adenosine deaminase-related metal-dependent hydrolase
VSQGRKGIIIRAATVVTMDGPPILGGAVRVDGNRIVEVAPEISGDRVVDLADHVLLPGLINTHCHLDYTVLRGKIPPLVSFADWIRAINAEKAKLTADDYLHSIAEGAAEAQRFGTTSLVNLEAFPDLAGRVQPMPLRTWWCAELIDINASGQIEQVIADAMAKLASAKNVRGGIGLAPHAPFTASRQLYKRCLEMAGRENLLLITHLAESTEEMEMFRERKGRLFEFLESLGRLMDDCGGMTPLGVFLRRIHQAPQDSSTWKAVGARNDQWIVAHLNELTDDDFELLERLPSKFSIAHCSRSHSYFGHSAFAYQKLEALEFNICLATDSLASNPDLNLFAEMRAFRKAHSEVGVEKILQMVTLNPAKALGAADRLGRIRVDYLADLIALPLAGPTDVYEQIINFEKTVPWMMIDGEMKSVR